MIDYSCAPEVTVEMRSRNSLVTLGLFYTLKDCKLEATSVCAVCIRDLFLGGSQHDILYIHHKNINC